MNEFTIHVPSLVECREDILPLAEFLREQASKELKREVAGFDTDARKALVNYELIRYYMIDGRTYYKSSEIEEFLRQKGKE